MNDDDLWLPTPTVMDATRHTSRAVWRPGENWRGVALVNAILDAGEIRCLPFVECAERRHRRDHVPGSAHSTNPSGTVGEIMGGTHTADMSENELFATPNCMDMIAPRSGRALEYVLRRGDPKRGMPVAADNMSITVPGPYHGGLWGLDDGRGVRFGRFTAAIRRWERVSGRPAPCPTQATGGLRRWIGANAADPTLFEPYWLARHAPFDAHPKARLDQPMRDRMLARWRETDRGMSLIDPMFWPGCKDMDPDIPIPATRLPDKSVLDYWKTRSVGSRFPSAAHLSPRFVEWMMGLEDGWVTNPAIWRHVDGNHRNLQLRALGNGVVPPQAAMAVDWALRVRERLAV